MPIFHQLQISMTPSTVTALRLGDYQLCVGKGVLSTTNDGLPTVWYTARQTILSDMIVSWSSEYRVQASPGASAPGAASAKGPGHEIKLGQTFGIAGVDGTGAVSAGGVPGGITVANQTGRPMVGSLSQIVMGEVAPMCALALQANLVEVIMPVERVLLMFAPTSFTPGMALAEAPAAGVLVDLRSVEARTVAFDIGQGWSWGGGAWALPVARKTALAPLLVGSSPFLLQYAARTRLAAEVGGGGR